MKILKLNNIYFLYLLFNLVKNYVIFKDYIFYLSQSLYDY